MEEGMERGGGGGGIEAEGVWGEVTLRGFVAAEETRRRRLSPAEGRPP